MYRKATANPTAGQESPLPFTALEDTDISKSTNRFTTNTTYDDAGNVVQDTKFRNLKFAYDANGRMIKTSNVDNTNQANSIYDASGQRVATRVYDEWKYFIYDIGGKMVAEYGGTPSTDEGGVKYVLQDWQGSTRAIIGNSGYVQVRQDFTAFGEQIAGNVGLRASQSSFNASNNLNQKYGLTERDLASGLDHTWWRKLENQAGRWTSPDPYNGSMSLNNPQSFNRYSYVSNQPTNFVDPSGLYYKLVCDLWTYFSDATKKKEVGPRFLKCYYVWVNDTTTAHNTERPEPGGIRNANSGITDKAKADKFTQCFGDKLETLNEKYISKQQSIESDFQIALSAAGGALIISFFVSFFTGNPIAAVTGNSQSGNSVGSKTDILGSIGFLVALAAARAKLSSSLGYADRDFATDVNAAFKDCVKSAQSR